MSLASFIVEPLREPPPETIIWARTTKGFALVISLLWVLLTGLFVVGAVLIATDVVAGEVTPKILLAAVISPIIAAVTPRVMRPSVLLGPQEFASIEILWTRRVPWAEIAAFSAIETPLGHGVEVEKRDSRRLRPRAFKFTRQEGAGAATRMASYMNQELGRRVRALGSA